MASKTKNSKDSKKQTSILLVHKILGSKFVGNQQYILEPPPEEEKWRIYQSQVLIPISISSKTRAIACPLPNINAKHERLKDYFPTYHRTKPIASRKKSKTSDETVSVEPNTVVDTQAKSLTEPIEKPINLDYMSNGLRVFCSCSLSKDPENYLSWLTKLEN